MFITTIAKGKTMATPDVCKTPTPGGPVPIPYVNNAMTMMGNPSTKKVLVNGSPALTKNSIISMSNGDNAGVTGGVASNAFMQKVQFVSASKKVKFQGNPVVRVYDQIKANKGNAMGTVIQPSQSKVDAS